MFILFSYLNMYDHLYLKVNHLDYVGYKKSDRQKKKPNYTLTDSLCVSASITYVSGNMWVSFLNATDGIVLDLVLE